MATRHPHDLRCAPWWVYALIAVAVNIVRQIVFPPSQVGSLWTVALFVVIVAVTGIVVTLCHRTLCRLTRRRT